MSNKLIPFDIADFLDSDRAIVEYLHQVLAGGDKDELRRALVHIAKAKGIAESCEPSSVVTKSTE
jgi:probable addiction module antidote protein